MQLTHGLMNWIVGQKSIEKGVLYVCGWAITLNPKHDYDDMSLIYYI